VSRLHDTELADAVAATNRGRKAPAELATPADRSSARWQRVRAALCEHHGLGKHFSLDEYADLVWSAVSNATAPAAGHRVTLRGRGQEGA